MKKPFYKYLIKPLLLAVALLPLSSCDSLFKPKTMTIEYDEEVKLHDGSMIWVHITRHYGLVGGGFEFKSSYMPSNVEISWDTGFEGVGRKSVFFDEQIYMINKLNNKWFITGAKNNGSPKSLGNSINCNTVGVFYGDFGCMVTINENGEFIHEDRSDLNGISKNILYSIGIKDWGLVPEPLANTKLSWNEKLKLQATQKPKRRVIGKVYKTY